MAILLDATIGGLNSNSYVTEARSNVIAETLPHMGEWLSDPSINKRQLLVHATRLIDRHFLPRGTKADSTQALWWPQSGLYYANTATGISASVIPAFLELATVEWAWALHRNPDVDDDFTGGLESLSTPSYSMNFTGSSRQKVPSVVSDLLAPYVGRQPRAFVRLVRT